MMKMMNLLMLLLSVMLGVAFYTLMERKMIGYTQSRKGPNKSAMLGMIQPIADAIKLIAKEANLNLKSNLTLFLLTPLINISCSLITWMVMPFAFTSSFMKMSMMFMLSCMAVNTLVIMMMSWSSNSNYAFIGMMRAVSQMISYEINLIMMMMMIISLTEKLDFLPKMEMVSMTIVTFPMIIVWMSTILAETNRTPFDFSEGESELISGFNVEYGGPSFMMLFLAEYTSILLMSYVTVCMFFNTSNYNFMFYALYFSICCIFIWSRTTLPRFRYDKLMKINWTQMLPITTVAMMCTFITKMY